MRQLGKVRFGPFRGQRGFSLIEILVAVGILAFIGVAFMTSMSTAYKSVGVLDEKTLAESLAWSQLEQIKNAPFESSDVSAYPRTDMYQDYLITDLPPQYSISIHVETPTCIGEADNCTPLKDMAGIGDEVEHIQEIKVSVFRTESDGDRPVFSVSCYKSKLE